MDFLRGRSYKEYLTNLYGSIDNLFTQAQSGELVAQQDLGTAYAYGIEDRLPINNDQAIRWLNVAMDNGCAEPSLILQLGVLYITKESVEGSKYKQKAYELYLKAAEMGCVTAERNLGDIYRGGLEGVVDEDINEAFKWLKRAAGQITVIHDNKIAGTMRMLGFEMKLRALYQLFMQYLSGECPELKPQLGKALYYLTRAAELGDLESQRELGRFHMLGMWNLGYTDLGKAERWLEKAANKGDPESHKLLDRCRKESERSPANQDRKANADHLKQTADINNEKMLQGLSQHPFVNTSPIILNEELLTRYPDSPTAQIYLKAYMLMDEGLKLLRSSNYTDSRGLSLFAQGYLTECTVLDSFVLSDMEKRHIMQFAARILRTREPLRCEGLLVNYALMPSVCSRPEGYRELDQARITTLDKLIHLIQETEPCGEPQVKLYEFGKCYSNWLYELFYMKASLYTDAHLYDEAVKFFSKSLELCPSNFEANIGLGYSLFSGFMACEGDVDPGDISQEVGGSETEEWYQEHQKPAKKIQGMHQDTWRRIKKLYTEFLEKSPKCAKNYPSSCYDLAKFYMLKRNIPKMQEYFKQGQDAEEIRLQFLEPVDSATKNILSRIDQLTPSARCSNPQCKKKRSTGELKGCPCLKATYCDRECQRADWKNHKSVCSAKQPKKTKK